MWFWHCYSRFLLHLTNHRCGSDNAIRCFCYMWLIIDGVMTLLYEILVTWDLSSVWFWHCYTRVFLHLTNHRCGSGIAIRGFCYIWLLIDVVLTLQYEDFVTSDKSSRWFWHCYTRFLLHLTNHRCGSDIAIRGFCYIWLIIDEVLTMLYDVFVTCG